MGCQRNYWKKHCLQNHHKSFLEKFTQYTQQFSVSNLTQKILQQTKIEPIQQYLNY